MCRVTHGVAAGRLGIGYRKVSWLDGHALRKYHTRAVDAFWARMSVRRVVCAVHQALHDAPCHVHLAACSSLVR